MYSITTFIARLKLRKIVLLKKFFSQNTDRLSLNQLKNMSDFVHYYLLQCWKIELCPDFKIIRNKVRPLRKDMCESSLQYCIEYNII